MMNVSANMRTSNRQVSFTGFNPVKKLTNFAMNADFSSINTSTHAVMVLYTACIGSRLINSRDKHEFRETFLRDSIGWASLFFISKAAEKVITYGLEKISKRKNIKESLFAAKESIFPKGLKGFWDVIKPTSKLSLKSFHDIKYLDCNPEIKRSLMRNKSISYLLSLGIAIGTLGIFIPLLNTVMTRDEFKNKSKNVSSTNNLPGNNPIQPQKLTMQGFLELSSKK